MKKNFGSIVLPILLTAFSIVTLPAFADTQTSDAGTSESFNWGAMKSLVSGCAVQPITKLPSGRTRFMRVVSLCPEVLAVTGSVAQFSLEGAKFTAVLLNSPLADEGDLNTLIVRNSEGQIVAKAEHVPAFGDILLALAGGQNVFRQIPVDSREW